MWNRVSLYIRYVDDRSINIKHYKCCGYSSNILIKISIPQNKKEMFLDFIDCAMLLGLLTIIWRATLGHTGPCTSWIVQWKILHLFPIPRLRWILLALIAVRRSPCQQPYVVIFLALSFKKDDIQRETSKSFCWIINKHK